MNQQLQNLIREARLELRRASGLPLTPEEQAEEQRTSEIEQMENFLMKALGIRTMIQLYFKVIWTERGATGQFTAEDHHFHLSKDGDGYRLFGIDSRGERELLNLTASDPNFGRRVVVAIGDALLKP